MAAFVQRLCRELERESVSADEYQQTLGAMMAIFLQSPVLMPCLLEHQFHVLLVKMVNRVTRGKEPYRERVKAWRAGFKFHKCV